MTDTWVRQLEAWHDFYVIVGAAAAQLMGLMFVVVSLSTNVGVPRSGAAVRAFLSPTVVFFATIVLVAAAITVPPLPPLALGVLLAAGGAGGVTYMVATRGHQMWRESRLDRLDWWWYVGLPFAAYLALAGAGAAVLNAARLGLHLVAAAVVTFLIVGIRNAWDLVLFMTRQPPGSARDTA